MRCLILYFAIRICPKTRFRITKTCLYNFDPLKAHFYIVKLRFTGVYIIFLISARKQVLTSTHNLCFEQQCEKYQSFLSENFQFLDMKFSKYLNRRVFVMASCGPNMLNHVELFWIHFICKVCANAYRDGSVFLVRLRVWGAFWNRCITFAFRQRF